MTLRISEPYTRKTLPLQNSFSTNNARLDFTAHLRLLWADRWVAEAGGPKAPHSALIRRAVALYTEHLEALPPGARRLEIHCIKSAALGSQVSPLDQEAALSRLRATDGPLEPCKVVLKGQYRVDEDAAFNASLEGLDLIPIKSTRSRKGTTP